MNLKHYYAYKTAGTSGMDTMGLMPISKDAVYIEGKLFERQNVLVLVSSTAKEAFDLIDKFDEDGQILMSNKTRRPKQERLRVQVNFNHQLVGTDIEWFANNYIENSEEFLKVYEGFKIKPMIEPASNMETVEDVKSNLIITAE